MSTPLKWGVPNAIATALSTELNSLGNTSRTAQSAAIDNETNLEEFIDLELNVTFGVAPSAGGYVNVYHIPSLDSTNYGDGDASIAPQKQLIIETFEVRAVTTAQKLEAVNIPIPPLKFKLVVEDQSGQAFPASGSTLKYRTHSEAAG